MEFLIIFWNDNSTSSRRSSLKEDVIPSRKNSNATSNPKVYSVDKRERGGRQRWNLLCILHSPRLEGKLEGVVIAGMATGARFMEKLWLRCRSRAPHFQLNNAITASRRKPTLLYSFHHFLPFHRCFSRCFRRGINRRCNFSLSFSFSV